ncbi:MAG: MoaD/ThiS family protein [Leptospira sp.]|nr:MoaD/ThiS family protein [Leptospira sp.]
MKVKILCFAGLRDFFPSQQEIELENIITVSEFKNFMVSNNPNAKEIIRISRVSLNQIIVNDSDKIQDGAIIAILPPSSGG